jgi:hypothetical protein
MSINDLVKQKAKRRRIGLDTISALLHTDADDVSGFSSATAALGDAERLPDIPTYLHHLKTVTDVKVHSLKGQTNAEYRRGFNIQSHADYLLVCRWFLEGQPVRHLLESSSAEYDLPISFVSDALSKSGIIVEHETTSWPTEYRQQEAVREPSQKLERIIELCSVVLAEQPEQDPDVCYAWSQLAVMMCLDTSVYHHCIHAPKLVSSAVEKLKPVQINSLKRWMGEGRWNRLSKWIPTEAPMDLVEFVKQVDELVEELRQQQNFPDDQLRHTVDGWWPRLRLSRRSPEYTTLCEQAVQSVRSLNSRIYDGRAAFPVRSLVKDVLFRFECRLRGELSSVGYRPKMF